MPVTMPVAVPHIVPLAPSVALDRPAPRFIVGQDPQGHWVAAEIHGLAGGLFRTRRDAMDYATDATGHRPDAVTVCLDRIELRL